MATLYLFRHGETDFNRDHIFTGWLDSKLTPKGIKQAQYLGQLLASKKISLAYQTRLSRSQETLKYVLKNHPECQQILTDNRLIERSYGILSGHSHQETIQKFGQKQFDLWHRGWEDKVEGGESLKDVESRVKDFLKDLISQKHPYEFGIAISAHGNSIRVFRKIMEKASVSETCSWTIPYDTYFQYHV